MLRADQEGGPKTVSAQIREIGPISGWALDYVVALDVHWPGIAGEFLRFGPERRQVIATLLATIRAPSDASDAIHIAEFVSRAGHKEILAKAFGTVPNGMRGALARSGSEPHPRSFYRMLFHLLSSPEKVRIASVIRQLERIDPLRLRIAQRLPTDICTARLVGILESPRRASDVAKLMHLFSGNGIDRKALAEAVRRVSSPRQFSDLWNRWSQKLSFPDHPVSASDRYTPVRTGAELRRLALRYRNCARRYLTQIMEGETAFAEFVYSGRRGVILLARTNDDWTMDAVFGIDNEMPDPELRSAAMKYLASEGIKIPETSRVSTSDWAVLRRVSAPQMFGF